MALGSTTFESAAYTVKTSAPSEHRMHESTPVFTRFSEIPSAARERYSHDAFKGHTGYVFQIYEELYMLHNSKVSSLCSGLKNQIFRSLLSSDRKSTRLNSSHV